MKRHTMVTLVASAVVALTSVLPLAAQQTGPSHAGYDPNASVGGHEHIGELGEKLLVIETSLKCNCSCNLDVHSCQFQMMCGTSPGWTARIRRDLEAGMDAEAIQASFVADFGGRVLMSPPAEGFNLLGYLLPSFAIVTAGMLVGIIARGGASRSALAPVEELTDEDAERLREALDRLDVEESPDW